MITVSTYINNDPDYLQARNDYTNDMITTFNTNTELDLNFRYLRFHKSLKDSTEEKREVYLYNDGNKTAFFMIDTSKTLNRLYDPPREYVSFVFESDENGDILDYTDDWIIENYGTTFLTTHFASVYDLNYESFNVINRIHDEDEDEDDEEIHTESTEIINIINSFETIDSSIDCAICLDDNVTIRKVQTKCNHIFHYDCIVNWVNSGSANNKNCPYCRERLI